MPYRKPSADEFEVQENKVVHRPTGATFTCYPKPTLSTDMHVNYKQAGNVLPNGDDYDREDIKAIAQKLLFGSQ